MRSQGFENLGKERVDRLLTELIEKLMEGTEGSVFCVAIAGRGPNDKCLCSQMLISKGATNGKIAEAVAVLNAAAQKAIETFVELITEEHKDVSPTDIAMDIVSKQLSFQEKRKNKGSGYTIKFDN